MTDNNDINKVRRKRVGSTSSARPGQTRSSRDQVNKEEITITKKALS